MRIVYSPPKMLTHRNILSRCAQTDADDKRPITAWAPKRSSRCNPDEMVEAPSACERISAGRERVWVCGRIKHAVCAFGNNSGASVRINSEIHQNE
jgi:hypothetical protein